MENKVRVWLARDKDRELFVYSDIPIRCKNHWGHPTCFYIDKSMFPSIKWEDDEPTEAYITLAEPQEQTKQEQNIDWEQRRYEIAKEMLPVLYQQSAEILKCGQSITREETAVCASVLADTLIAKLKEQSE